MIYVECYPDQALVHALGIVRKEITHAHSKGNVCNRLVKVRDRFGMIDEDPASSQPSYLRKLKEQWRQNEVKLLYDGALNNFIIVLCPRLEEWILKAAKECNVRIEEFGLPASAHELHKTIGSNIANFKKLLEAIKTKSHRIQTLAGALRV